MARVTHCVPSRIAHILSSICSRRSAFDALETRLRAGFRMLRMRSCRRRRLPASRQSSLVLRQPLGVRSADQDAVHGNLVDRGGDNAARVWISILRPQGNFVLALFFAIVIFALVQQHGASRFQLLRKRGDGLARLGHIGTMGLASLVALADLGSALADRKR